MPSEPPSLAAASSLEASVRAASCDDASPSDPSALLASFEDASRGDPSAAPASVEEASRDDPSSAAASSGAPSCVEASRDVDASPAALASLPVAPLSLPLPGSSTGALPSFDDEEPHALMTAATANARVQVQVRTRLFTRAACGFFPAPSPAGALRRRRPETAPPS